MKKYFKFLLCMMLIMPCLFMFTACDSGEVVVEDVKNSIEGTVFIDNDKAFEILDYADKKFIYGLDGAWDNIQIRQAEYNLSSTEILRHVFYLDQSSDKLLCLNSYGVDKDGNSLGQLLYVIDRIAAKIYCFDQRGKAIDAETTCTTSAYYGGVFGVKQWLWMLNFDNTNVINAKINEDGNYEIILCEEHTISYEDGDITRNGLMVSSSKFIIDKDYRILSLSYDNSIPYVDMLFDYSRISSTLIGGTSFQYNFTYGAANTESIVNEVFNKVTLPTV